VIGVDAASFLVIVAIAALAGLLVTIVGPRLVIPVVVVELVLGILVGPQVAGIARLDPATQFFGNLGLGMLFFFAGYEINFERIKGQPLKLAGTGWLISLVLAYAMAGVLAATGVVVSGLYTGSAIATTAIGTLIPILRDAGELRTRFGTYLLAAGAAAEFGPILLVTLVLSTGHPAARGADSRVLRRAGGCDGHPRRSLRVAGLGAHRADLRGVQPARGQACGRPGVRARCSRERARA